MPDRRRHRGPHPDDPELFAPERVPALRTAVAELSWLLGRGYAEESARKLVGDRHALTARQRIAVARCACSDAQLSARAARCLPLADVGGAELRIDGFNLLTTIEAAFAGGVLLRARDQCLRDLASLHGHWKRVAETIRAAEAIGDHVAAAGVTSVHWLLDEPVGNSARLAVLLRHLSSERRWNWRVELVPSADRVLRDSRTPIVTADSAVLDRCAAWCNVAPELVTACAPDAWIVDLRPG